MPDGDPTGGQGGTATDVQPPAGQGGGGGDVQPKDGGGGFNWDLFPDVPEAQRPLLEPHLKQVQGHVTQLEQQYAPYKDIMSSGAKADDLQNLIQLDAAFSKDPVGTWVQLGQNMQQAGQLSGDLDLDEVQAILSGQSTIEEPGGTGGTDTGDEDVPAWAQQLQRENQELRQQQETRTQEAQAQQQQAQLQKAMAGMRTQLKEAGYDDADITDEMLTGAIIAHQGDADKALASLTGLRESVLKAFTSKGSEDQNGSGSGEGDGSPDMPKGPPKTPKRQSRGAGREFAEARQGAAQMLEQRMRAEAQGS